MSWGFSGIPSRFSSIFQRYPQGCIYRFNAIYTDLNVSPVQKIILQYFLPEYRSLSQSSQNIGLRIFLPAPSDAIHRFLSTRHRKAPFHGYSQKCHFASSIILHSSPTVRYLSLKISSLVLGYCWKNGSLRPKNTVL